jgi:hypothetical protein
VSWLLVAARGDQGQALRQLLVATGTALGAKNSDAYN